MYPINFDFGQHWESKIKPHLDDPRVKRAYRRGVNNYLNNWENNIKKYKRNTAPANYSSKDYYCMLRDRQEDIIIDQLRQEGNLPKKYLDLEHGNDDDDDDDNSDKWFEMREKILKPYFTWDKIKYKLETYYLSGGCHWYAPTFELTLARLVEPDERWRVRTSDKHTTVINHNNTKIFDLLYWVCNNRLENYLFGDPIPENKVDPTLGGKDAYEDSTLKSKSISR